MDCIILEFYYKSPAYTLMTRQVPTCWKEDECVRMNHVLGGECHPDKCPNYLPNNGLKMALLIWSYRKNQ